MPSRKNQLAESSQVRLSRRLLQFRKRSTKLKRLVPDRAGAWMTDLRSLRTELRPHLYAVEERTSFDNVFHITLHKSGSQWVLGLLTDPIVFKYSGLTHFHPGRIARGVSTRDRWYTEPFPRGAIVGPLYVTRPQFDAVPKGSFGAFAVLRDPRELMVSWYYSALRNHPIYRKDGLLAKARSDLQERSLEQGLHYAIDFWSEHGRFEAFRSWAESSDRGDVLVLTYEQLTGPDHLDHFRGLFQTLDIRLPERELVSLLAEHGFSRARKRQTDEVDTLSMRRAGGRVTWPDHLSPAHLERIDERIGDAMGLLGYHP